MDTINKKSLLRGKTFSRLLVVLFAAFMISLLAFATADDAAAEGEPEDEFTITWVVHGVPDDTTIVKEGFMPTYDEPTRAADEVYTYAFNGWNPTLKKVTEDTSYEALWTSTPIADTKYTITWIVDGTESTTEVNHDAMPSYSGIPTKDKTNQYTFEFDGWDSEVVKATEDATYTATWEMTLQKYDITWNVYEVDENDNKTLVPVLTDVDNDIAYGTKPIYDETKLKTLDITYTIGDWENDETGAAGVVNVVGDVEYKAIVTSKDPSTYQVIFNDGMRDVSTKSLDYGAKIIAPAEPTKDDDKYATGYTFSQWKTAEGTVYYTAMTVYEDMKFIAEFNSIPKDYTITWKVDGEVYKTDTYHFDDEITAPADPTKDTTDAKVFTFDKWNGFTDEMTVTGDRTFNAVFSEEVREYTITWIVDGGETDKTIKVPFNGIANFGSNKVVTDETTYTITKWTPSPVRVTENAEYTATFTTAPTKYTVTFDIDGNLVTKDLDYGAKPTFVNEYVKGASTYVITGWDTDFDIVTEDVTYKAGFDKYVGGKNVTERTITWKIGDEIETTIVVQNDIPVFGSTYVTDESTYTITKWTPDIGPATKNQTYVATFMEVTNTYEITADIDGNIEKATLEYGDPVPNVPTYVTDEFTYTITKWTPELPATVTGDQTYVATFTKVTNIYTVTWDVREVEFTNNLYYNSVITALETPPDYTDSNKDYTFSHWVLETDEDVVFTAGTKITENVTYVAVFDDVTEYTITWKVGSEETKVKLTNGEVIVAPADPTKESTDSTIYSFDKWIGFTEGMKVTADVLFVADFKGTTITHTITWIVDGYETTSTVDHGTTEANLLDTILGADPTRSATDEFTFVFTGWDPAVVDVVEDATYTATFGKNTNMYTVTFEDTSRTHDYTEPYGTKIVQPIPSGKDADNQYDGYTFKEWKTADGTVYTPGMKVTGKVIFDAVYEGIGPVKEYTITWDVKGTKTTTQVAYGETPSYGDDPTKEATAQYTYEFSGFFDESDAKLTSETTVEGPATYTAMFSETTNEYTVTWIVDGITVKTEKVAYGLTPNVGTDFDVPHYTFSNVIWDVNGVVVKDDVTYTASSFDVVVERYAITWASDGNVLGEDQVAYGAMPNHYAPVKPADGKYTYEFVGWSPEVSEVVGPMDYDAVFSKTLISFDITWEVDGHADKITNVNLNVMPSYGAIPTKASDDDYSYKFVGWGPEVVKATGDATYTALFEQTALDADVVDDDTGDDNTALYVGLAVVVIIVVGVIAVFAVRAKN